MDKEPTDKEGLLNLLYPKWQYHRVHVIEPENLNIEPFSLPQVIFHQIFCSLLFYSTDIFNYPQTVRHCGRHKDITVNKTNLSLPSWSFWLSIIPIYNTPCSVRNLRNAVNQRLEKWPTG